MEYDDDAAARGIRRDKDQFKMLDIVKSSPYFSVHSDSPQPWICESHSLSTNLPRDLY